MSGFSGSGLQHRPQRVLGRMSSDRTLARCWWECKMAQLLWKTVRHFLTKLHIVLPCDPAIALLSRNPREQETYVHTKTFIYNCHNLEAPEMSLVVNRLWFIRTLEYYLVKRNGGNSNAYYSVREAGLKWLHPV